MLSIPQHREALIEILQNIYRDNELSAQLVFKGGTCLMLFYDLDRFSTDLDFNLRKEGAKIDSSRVAKVASETVEILDEHKGRQTYSLSGRYDKGQRILKIDVSARRYPQKIINIDFYGVSVSTLAPEQMFAHKLCALSERQKNRDLYDAHFMFKQKWDIDEEIVRARKNMSVVEYLRKLAKTIDTPEIRNDVLEQLGEVLDRSQKDWARAKLVDELLVQLAMRADNLEFGQ